MRITGGELRSRVVPGRVPAGVRPTGSKVRQALFNALGQDLSGVVVLDAYAGSGLMSFEALSRGAERATLVEKNGKTAGFIEKAARSLGLEERVEVRVGTSPAALGEGSWDLVFLDPPYTSSPEATLSRLEGRVRWRLVLESARDTPSPEAPGLELLKRRDYGRSSLSIYGVRSR